jgi:hypothetical protein
MDTPNQPVREDAVQPWPPGWPLPVSAVAPSHTWQYMVQVYLAYARSILGTSDEAAREPNMNDEVRPAA